MLMALGFNMEKLWNYGQNYGTMDKNMVLNQKLLFMKGKNMISYQNLFNFDL